jgi:hypothetical protein
MRCEYVVTASRGGYLGDLCSLTGRACYADPDKPMGHTACIRRTWANEYVGKYTADINKAAIAAKSPI